MKLKDGRINLLISPDSTTIEIIDNEASTTFCLIKLTPENLSRAMSRQAHVPCEIELIGLDRVGKRMEHKSHEFEMEDYNFNNRKEVAIDIAKKTLPEGWVISDSFSSQNTFFDKDGKKYARCTIRRYV